MKEIASGHFYSRLHHQKKHCPLAGQIELTYRCGLNCIHCYCTGLEGGDKELSTTQWKKVLDELQKQGCVYLGLSGGDPLIRKDFLELYSYAKRKCFIITIFTNGQALSRRALDYLAKSPPFSIEITLNGITQKTYEAITRVKGSFSIAMGNIKKIKERRLPLILKSNCLKQNKNEIGKIKAFADGLLGKERVKFHFKYDPMIYPRLNRDKTPTNFRLSFQELSDLRKQDADIWQQYQSGIDTGFPDLERDKSFLYRCTAWREQFFINPYGRLKFCNFSEKFSIDLKTTPFKEGFYKQFPQLLTEKFKTNSKCRNCRLRPVCYHCPARAYLETGDEETPVLYYCRLAKAAAGQLRGAPYPPARR
jgi:radical SAM protein with 4Fe4S-binding SPASM domain